MHIATAIAEAQEASDMIREISSDQLAWLLVKSDFRLLPEWESRAVLIAEVIRRLAPETLAWEETSNGWVTDAGSVIDYNFIDNEK